MKLFQMKTKVRSAALYFALVVSICFLSLIGAVFLKFQLDQYIISRELKFSRSLSIAIDGQKLLNGFKLNYSDNNVLKQPYSNSNEEVRLITKPWGRFIIGYSIAQNEIKSDTLVHLYGFEIPYGIPNLYLADKNRPLAVCGKTLLRGDLSLPKAGIKRAYIEGENFRLGTLFQGKTQLSERYLKKFYKEPDIKPEEYNYYGYKELKKQSFRSPTILIEKKNLVLNDSLSGNIILRNEGLLTLTKHSHLEDVIIETDSLKVESGFHGSGQFFVKYKATIKENSFLQYPSFLEIKIAKPQKEVFKLENYAILVGGVCIQGNENAASIIEPNASIIGGIETTGKLILNGACYGYCYLNGFYQKTPSSIYENHLLDAVFSNELPKGFALPKNHFSNNLKSIKWLN